jgi:hypothetical protein
VIIVNMWFIKHSNGLFHYGLDYASALGRSVREVWVRNAGMAMMVNQRLPEVDVRIVGMRDVLSGLACAGRNSDLVFTPSSHPVALIFRQVVVVHDSFPFVGRLGAIKLAMFRIALLLSGAWVAYVNRSDSYRFLRSIGLADKRMHYLPNHIPLPHREQTVRPIHLHDNLVVGLFGSDSPKKNYHHLFASFEEACQPSSLSVVWRIYGHDNAYTQELRARFSNLVIEVVRSDELPIAGFLSSIDLAVSGALGEGFGRPIAAALVRGIPTMLIDTPVFREFYADSAKLFSTMDALTTAIAALRSGQQLERSHLASGSVLRKDFSDAVAWLRSV